MAPQATRSDDPAGEDTPLLPHRPRSHPSDAIDRPAPKLDAASSPWDDLRTLREGSVPQSAVAALVVSAVCGVGCYAYYLALELLLDVVWRVIPETYVAGVWPAWSQGFYIPLVGLCTCVLLGCTVAALGEPGDLAYTIDCVHKRAFVPLNHVGPMVAASLVGIVGGGSLGPEAPLVAICAALGGNVSFYVFRQRNKNVMRKHTLMGMAAALAAFFGAPMGGSIFALEVCSKFGIEYFEHTIESIFCGLLTMLVFRSLTGGSVGPVWSFPSKPLAEADMGLVATAGAIGALGALAAFAFMHLHWKVMSGFQRLGLLADTRKAVPRALLGGVVIYSVGMFIPHTLFWGEAEFQTLWNLRSAETLEHVWPKAGLVGFEMDTPLTCALVGIAKLVTISFTVAGGFRGGFIFPFFSAGAAFGRALAFFLPSLPPTVVCLSFAAGINVAVTKTALATTIILVYLSGEQNAQAPVLAASIVSLLLSSYMPFIKTQISREDDKPAGPAEAGQTGEDKAGLREFRSAALVLMLANHPQDELKEAEEEGVPLAKSIPSLRHHTQRIYII